MQLYGRLQDSCAIEQPRPQVSCVIASGQGTLTQLHDRSQDPLVIVQSRPWVLCNSTIGHKSLVQLQDGAQESHAIAQLGLQVSYVIARQTTGLPRQGRPCITLFPHSQHDWVSPAGSQ